MFGCAPEQVIGGMDPIVRDHGVVPIVCDITRVDDIVRLRDTIGEQTGGRLDILYNNAGIAIGGPAVEFEDDQMKRLFDINLLGHIYVTKYLIKYVVERKGSVVFTSSLAARVPLAWTSLYCASKAAIDQYAMGLHAEMKPFGVRVHSVITGGVNTAIGDSSQGARLPPGSLFDVPAMYESTEASAAMTRNTKTSILPSDYAQQVVSKIISPRDPGFNIYRGGFAYSTHILGRWFPLFISEWVMAFQFKQLKVWQQIREKYSKKLA